MSPCSTPVALVCCPSRCMGLRMSQEIGLFGYPLAHSISPAFQQAALDYYSLPVRYYAWPTPPEALYYEVCKLRDDKYLGANVTIPHKEQVLGLLDGVDGLAGAVGAVNTIVKKDRDLIGYNTDVCGIVRSLREKAGFEPEGKSMLLLGAGGAARAAAFGMASEGIASLTIANRTKERASGLADEVRGSIGRVRAISMEEATLAEASAEADLIVNATSVGMDHGDAQGRTPLYSELIPPGVLVFDMVYTPSETPLLLEARKAGAHTLGGLWMLIYQGAASFELWTGRKAPLEVMFRAGEDALSAQSR